MNKIIACVVCEKTINKSQVNRHMRNVHKWTEEQLQEKKVNERKGTGNSSNILNCTCGANPFSRWGLDKHILVKGCDKPAEEGMKLNFPEVEKVPCPVEGCGIFCGTQAVLAAHCDVQHQTRDR